MTAKPGNSGGFPLLFGPVSTPTAIEKVDDSSGAMRFSGWLTTEDPDYANHILKAEGAVPYFGAYQANPIYCYNHDRDYPIGKVLNPQVVTSGNVRGVYLENIELLSIPFVTEYVWKTVQEEVCRQQSVGMRPVAMPKSAGGALVFDAWRVIEGSLVPAAMNPKAVLTEKAYQSIIRQIEDECECGLTVKSLMDAAKRGVELPMISKNLKVLVPHNYGQWDMQMEETPEESTPAPTTNKAFGGLIVKTEGDAKPVAKDQKNAETLAVAVCASEIDKALPLGGIDAEGALVLDPKRVVTAVSLLCGARGGANSVKEENRELALEKACSAMRLLGMSPPATAQGTYVDQAVYGQWAYSELVWGKSESLVLLEAQVANALTEGSNLIKGLINAHGQEAAMPIVLKYVSEYVRIAGWCDSDTDRSLLQAALMAFAKAKEAKPEVEDESSMMGEDDEEYYALKDPILQKYVYASYDVSVGIENTADYEVVVAIMNALKAAKSEMAKSDAPVTAESLKTELIKQLTLTPEAQHVDNEDVEGVPQAQATVKKSCTPTLFF